MVVRMVQSQAFVLADCEDEGWANVVRPRAIAKRERNRRTRENTRERDRSKMKRSVGMVAGTLKVTSGLLYPRITAELGYLGRYSRGRG